MSAIISIEDFVHQNTIDCVSGLIYELTQKGCLEEEQSIELWQGSIDWETAESELQVYGDLVFD